MEKLIRWYIVMKDKITGVKDKITGATAVEYGLIVALIAIVIIIAVALLGTNLRALFYTIAGKLSTLPSSPEPGG